MEKDEVLLRCHRTVLSFEKIVKALKEADPKDLPALVEEIDIPFETIKTTINKAIYG
jgi:uncharacterized protein (DUF2344 family)